MADKFVDTDTDAFNFNVQPTKLDLKQLSAQNNTAAQAKWEQLSLKAKADAVTQFQIHAGPEWYNYARKYKIDVSFDGLVNATNPVFLAALLKMKE